MTTLNAHVRPLNERIRGHRLSPAEAEAIWNTFLVHLATMSANEAARQPGMPSQPAFAKKRKRDAAFDRRAAEVIAARSLQLRSGRKPISASKWAEFLGALSSASLGAVLARGGMPSLGAIYKHRQQDSTFRASMDVIVRDPERRRRYRDACAARLAALRSDPVFCERMLASLVLWRARQPAPERKAPDKRPVGEVFRAQLLENQLYAAAADAVPRGLPPHLRDEVISDIVLAVLEGEITFAEIRPSAREYLTRHRRLFGDHGTVSLDATIPGTDGAVRYIDRLPSDALRPWDLTP